MKKTIFLNGLVSDLHTLFKSYMHMIENTEASFTSKGSTTTFLPHAWGATVSHLQCDLKVDPDTSANIRIEKKHWRERCQMLYGHYNAVLNKIDRKI